jgi:hypothetical protein
VGLEEKARAALENFRIASTPPALDLRIMLHAKQYALATDTKRFRVARCSRRAGKTGAVPPMLLDSAIRKPGSVSLYVTKTAKRAKQLMWRHLLRMNSQYALGGVANGQDLSITLPNSSAVFLAGANTRDKIEDRRGDPFGCVVLDEAQTLPSYIEELVNDVLAPGLRDYQGSCILIGTPPPVPAGYFDAVCNNPEWSFHHFTCWDNPYFIAKLAAEGVTLEQDLAAELKRRGVTVEDPSIRREWFGEVAVDLNSLVFRYDAAKNDLPGTLPAMAGKVLGIDIGYEDADAFSVLGWPARERELYLVEEIISPKQTLTPLMNRVAALIAKHRPVGVVMDEGGLGKKIAETLTQEFGLPVEAADKQRKFEFIEMLNDMMRTAHFFASRHSRFAQDCALIEWDKDKSTPDRRVISDRYHSDACDSVLYAYRRALHWLPKAPEVRDLPAPGSAEWLALQAESVAKEQRQRLDKLLKQQFQRQREKKEQEEWNG